VRIAVIAPLFAPVVPAQPYGPNAFLVDLAHGLAARGHRLTVYCAAGSRIEGLRIVTVPVSPLVDAARVQPMAGSRGRASTAARPPSSVPADVTHAVRDAFDGVFTEIDHVGADVISQHAFDAEAIELAEGRPVLHTLHLPPIVESVVAAAQATTATLATVSETSRRNWEAAGVGGVRVLRNGIPDWDPDRPGVEPVALMAGRFSPEKGDAVGIRVAIRAGLRPQLIGEPYDRHYFEAEIVPLLDAVDLVPTLPRQELWRRMARAAVTLMPIAWEEPFGLIAAEAQMAGCPVVGYRRGALPEVVEEGVSGFLVAPGDEDGLVSAVGLARQLDRGLVRASARRRLGLTPAVDAYERTLVEIASATGGAGAG
jgi:UDP-glucose:tetrahydrobiopterin glucosyltransferase